MNKQLPPQRTSILWGRTLGLASVQGATSLLWVTYSLYLPKLLSQVGLPPWVAIVFLVLEGFIAVVLEPIAGQLSDQLKFKMSTRYPFVVAAGIAAALIFLALPTIAQKQSASSIALEAFPIVGWLFGAAIMAWAITMSLFRSPILALLGKCAPTQDLPKAASVLVIFSTLVGAVGTLWGSALKQLPPVTLFVISSLALLTAGFVLERVYPQSRWATPTLQQERIIPSKLPIRALSTLVLMGFILTFAIAQFKGVVSPTSAKLPGFLWFLTLHLVSLVPCADLAKAVGNSRLMGFAGIVIAVTLTGMIQIPPAAAHLSIFALLGLAFSPVVNGIFPWILSRVPEIHAGLGIGLFFSGASLAGATSALLSQTPLFLDLRLGLAAGAFFCASLMVLNSQTILPGSAR